MRVTPPATIAIYPGSFDPVTLGHVDIARRALQGCDHLIVAVGHNKDKTPTFSVPERLDMLRRELANLPDAKRVEVAEFDGLLASYAQQRGANWVVRGVRGPADWLNEAVMMGVNFCLGRGLRTWCIPASGEHATTSSTRARNAAARGEDLSQWVSPHVAARCAARLRTHSSS